MNAPSAHASKGLTGTFLDLPPRLCTEAAPVLILPLGHEATTSWMKGASGGPAAILAASAHVEWWDEELGVEACDIGIATHLGPDLPSAHRAALGAIEAAALEALRCHELVVSLGGEHSITEPLVRAHRAHRQSPIGVVQFDAHADLRDEYEGERQSHACVMRRVRELDVPTLSFGIRSLSREEAPLLDEPPHRTVLGRDLPDSGADIAELLAALPEDVYITFDVDFFDPAVLPATGTPEPGGGTWRQANDLLAAVFREKNVVGLDFVELLPSAAHPASDFLVARLIYRCIGLWAIAQRRIFPEAPSR